MKTTVHISGKAVAIETSTAATHALLQRKEPLLAEMELYFSCLVRKKVRFHEVSSPLGDANQQIRVTDELQVSFRPVITQSCSVADVDGDEPPVTDFEIKKPEAFIPHWLYIDFQNGQWQGEFGYQH